MSDAAIAELAPTMGVRGACDAVGVAQASYYRRHRHSPPPPRLAPIPQMDRVQPRALSATERAAILAELHSERFVDVSPTEVWATLLDEGRYLGSLSTFYRLLRHVGESKERRRQATHPATVKPELVAYKPNSVWSWDITKLRGPAKWSWYYLYVILDIFSRYVVGWMVASRESAALAEVLIRQTCAKQDIGRDQLTIHADRGSSMTSKPVAFLLADLGVTQSHSRPHVSNDNLFSEAQFAADRYFAPPGCRRLGSSLSPAGQLNEPTSTESVPRRQVLLFHASAYDELTPPIHRTPPGQHAGRLLAHSTPPRSGAPSSQGHLTTPVSMPSFYSFDASAVVHTRSSSRRPPDPLIAGLLPQRSPPRLLTDAACGGLSAPPARRTRRANLHHQHSTSRSGDLLHRHHSTFRTHSGRSS